MMEELFDGYLNQSLSPEQEVELEGKLQSPEARDAFAAYILETTQILEAALAADESGSTLPSRAKRFWLIGLAACLAFAFGVIAILQVPSPALLKIVLADGAVAENADLVPGTEIAVDQLKLQEGKLTIELEGGVALSLVGGTHVRFAGRGIHLDQGVLEANVPDGQEGFTVHTESGSVVDLGTRFRVDLRQGCIVSVLEGRVALRPSGGDQMVTVREGERFRMSPHAVTRLVEPARANGKVTLVSWKSTWRYWDQSQQLPRNWTAVSFNDSAWPSGAGRLGFGGDGEDTLLGRHARSKTKPITTWFRHSFLVDRLPRGDEMTLLLFVDDGAVVYLNGNELLRTNMPAGTILPSTLATRSREGAVFQFAVSAADLKKGRNQLAVEVHQWAETTSDLGFDLSLIYTE